MAATATSRRPDPRAGALPQAAAMRACLADWSDLADWHAARGDDAKAEGR